MDLARRAKLSQTTISDIERGRNDGSRELVGLAAALGVTPEWLDRGGVRGEATNPTDAVPSLTLTPAQRALLDDLDLLLDDDRARIAAEVRRLADVARAYRAKFGGRHAPDEAVARAYYGPEHRHGDVGHAPERRRVLPEPMSEADIARAIEERKERERRRG